MPIVGGRDIFEVPVLEGCVRPNSNREKRSRLESTLLEEPSRI